MLKRILLFCFYLIIIGENIMAKNSLPKYYEETLKNGLKVIAIPLKNNSNVITTDVFYNVGSRDEVMGKSGIAHMFKDAEKGDKEINVLRTEDALETKPNIIATGCPYCNTMMTDGIKFKEKEAEVVVKDIAELIAEANKL